MGKIQLLELEFSYHGYRDRILDIEHLLDPGLSEAHALLADYYNLLEQIDLLRKLVEARFKAALDHAIPPLNTMFTDVYQRLTQQRSYELVRIFHDPEKVGNLELRVASTHVPGQDFAINVLNGQASKALHLVPYLVFSRFLQGTLELDLLLIDDPSESFDTSHVSLLVEELYAASEHAQLIVASHEREKFLPALEQRFSKAPVTTLNVEDFDPIEGPRIEQR